MLCLILFSFYVNLISGFTEAVRFKQTEMHIVGSVTVAVSRAGFEVHRLASSMFTPLQNLSSFICLTITNLLCARSIHFSAPALPPSLSCLLSPPLSPLSSNSARGHKSPFCCFSGLALLPSPPPPPPPPSSQQVPVLG